jgi:hypothetical protein
LISSTIGPSIALTHAYSRADCVPPHMGGVDDLGGRPTGRHTERFLRESHSPRIVYTNPCSVGLSMAGHFLWPLFLFAHLRALAIPTELESAS